MINVEKKTIVVAVLFGAIILIVVFFVILPTIKNIHQIDQDTYNLRLYLEKKYERSISLKSTIKKIDDIKAEITDYNDRLFRSKDNLELITYLETTAAKNQVNQRILSSNLDNIANNQVTFSLAITGDYKDTLQYLNDLEHSQYFISIIHLNIAPYSDRTKPLAGGTVNMNIDLSLYVNY